MKLQRNPSVARLGRRGMNVFNSLGSNYNLGHIWRALTTLNHSNYSQNLISYLEKRYQGRAVLLYKNREAIRLGLEMLNLPKDSHVGICAFSCYVVDQAVLAAGYIPVYLDIDPQTLNFTADKIPPLKAIIVQNTLGYPANINSIKKFCSKHNVFLIEDLAHSAGGTYETGAEVGTVGDMTVLSFSQDKSIDAVSGGALIIRHPQIKLATFSFQSISPSKQLQDRLYPLLSSSVRWLYPTKLGKYWHWLLKKLHLLSMPIDPEDIQLQGLPHWQAKLDLEYFNQLNQINNHRQKIAQIYGNRLGINLRFPIFVKNRDSLVEFLKKHGIYVSDTWYDTPISPVDLCPNSEHVSHTIVNLPTHINISALHAQKIIHLVNQWHQSQ